MRSSRLECTFTQGEHSKNGTPSSCAFAAFAPKRLLPAEKPGDVHLFWKPWLSLGFTAERSGKGVLRHPPRGARETCAWKQQLQHPDDTPCDCNNLPSSTCSCTSSRSQPARCPSTHLWQVPGCLYTSSNVHVCGPKSPTRGRGVLPIMAYMGRLRPKGVPFSGFRYIKG